MWKGVLGIENHITECPCIDSAWFKLPVQDGIWCKWCCCWCCVVTREWWSCGTSSLLFFQEVQQKWKELLHHWNECLAPVLAIQHFKVYVGSSSLPVVVYSDHNPLVFIHKLKAKSTISEVEFKITRVCFGHQTHRRKGQCYWRMSLKSINFCQKSLQTFFLEGGVCVCVCVCVLWVIVALEISKPLSHADLHTIELPRTFYQVRQLLHKTNGKVLW